MKTVRTIKVKAGQEKFREAVKNELARKGARARIIIDKMKEDDGLIWRTAELDGYALELRHLAFQIHALQGAKLATEEA